MVARAVVIIARNVADTKRMGVHRVFASIVATCILACTHVPNARAMDAPAPVRSLNAGLHHLVARLPASSAVEVLDLATGLHVGYNANAAMPAASTIKVPVMVEVFRQLEAGRFDLNHRMTLRSSDKDYGSGDLCDEPAGTSYSVSDLLSKMIDVSDNTATNMLIRLVGRSHINATMERLGLDRTHLATDVRTSSWSVRSALRSSPADMVRLLALMAKRQLVDQWSSNEMISILEEDQINTLLPEPLPDDVPIAHKTGSFFDTLNDVGIVFEDDAPYVIAVMTTHLPSLSTGRSFIRSLSKLAFVEEAQLARWRTVAGIQGFAANGGVMPPDVRYWSSSVIDSTSGGE
jgi:beta-lactamase class A